MRCCRVPEGCGRYEKNTPPIANVQCPSTLNPLDPGESVTCMESLIVNDAQTTADGYCKFELTYAAKVNAAAG